MPDFSGESIELYCYWMTCFLVIFYHNDFFCMKIITLGIHWRVSWHSERNKIKGSFTRSSHHIDSSTIREWGLAWRNFFACFLFLFSVSLTTFYHLLCLLSALCKENDKKVHAFFWYFRKIEFLCNTNKHQCFLKKKYLHQSLLHY